MELIDEALVTALEIRDETNEGANTHAKIGGLFYKLAQILEAAKIQLDEASSDISDIVTDISDIDKEILAIDSNVDKLYTSPIVIPDLPEEEDYTIGNLPNPDNIYIINPSGPDEFPVYLPECSINKGKRLTIMSVDHSLTIFAKENELINGDVLLRLNAADNVTMVSIDNTNWIVLK